MRDMFGFNAKKCLQLRLRKVVSSKNIVLNEMEPICNDDLRKLIYKSKSMTDYDVAVVVHAMFKDRFQ